MVKASVIETDKNTSLHSRNAQFLHCAIALEVTSNSSMVEHQPYKLKDRVQIPRRPAYQASIQKHFFPLAQCNFNFSQRGKWITRNSCKSPMKC